jgi:hypothetical protein
VAFFVWCLGVIAFISYRCWFFARKPRTKPQPLQDTHQRYEALEDIALQLIAVGAGSSRQIRERTDQFYKDHPHPDVRERLKRALR